MKPVIKVFGLPSNITKDQEEEIKAAVIKTVIRIKQFNLIEEDSIIVYVFKDDTNDSSKDGLGADISIEGSLFPTIEIERDMWENLSKTLSLTLKGFFRKAHIQCVVESAYSVKSYISMRPKGKRKK
jgi:hypothetical protein